MRIPLAAALAAAALLAPASAGAVVPGGNLVVNPGAEAGTGSPDSSQVVPPPGWVVPARSRRCSTGRRTS
jgi:hypothetical protein